MHQTRKQFLKNIILSVGALLTTPLALARPIPKPRPKPWIEVREFPPKWISHKKISLIRRPNGTYTLLSREVLLADLRRCFPDGLVIGCQHPGNSPVDVSASVSLEELADMIYGNRTGMGIPSILWAEDSNTERGLWVLG